MPTHTMSKNANPTPIHLLEVLKNSLRQFGRDIAVHFVSFRPRFLGSVDVEASPAAEIEGVVFALDFQTT